MFELIDVKNYNTHHHYGTDWHTDYVIKTDEKITNVDEIIEKLQQIGKNPNGVCNLKFVEGKNQIIVLETVMF